MRAQALDRRRVPGDAQREMAVAGVHLRRAAQRARRIMDDEVQLRIAQGEPGAGKIEGRPGDLRQPQRAAVKTPGALEIGH